MEKPWEILLSGTLGALLAAFFAVWYQHRSEKIKNRKDVMIAVIEWLDNVYLRLQSMHIDKERTYTDQTPSLSNEEYRTMSDEVRVLLLSEKITTQVVCVFGEGETLQKINALQGELTKAARILWGSKKDTWLAASKEIAKIFKEKVDPIKASVMKDFFHSTGKVSILRREQMISRIKRIIAREGLILLGTIGLGGALVLIGISCRPSLKDIFDEVAESSFSYSSFPFGKMIYVGKLLIFLYPIILLVRFIIWAVKTLKKRERVIYLEKFVRIKAFLVLKNLKSHEDN